MQSQAYSDYFFEPVTSTTTTTNNNGLINQFQDYYNNNNHQAPCYSVTPDPEPQHQESQQNYYVTHQHQQQQQQQQAYLLNPSDKTRPDALSFALEEIGAVINSEEFNFISTNETNHNNNIIAKQANNTIEETEASIYENLKRIINESSADEANATNKTTFTDTTNDSNKSTGYQSYQDHHLTLMPMTGKMATNTTKPYVEIIEQPAKCALRFRYKCEGRSAGSLPGVNSTADNKTFPTIRINNYRDRAVVVISCVTKDAPYRAHPHNIVGKEGCKKGICTIVLNGDQNQDELTTNGEGNSNGCQDNNYMIRTFSSLGIQCVKRKDIEDSLNLRESINVDPFRNGFQHKLDTSTIDLNVIRLCFQVFIEGGTPNKCDIPLMPIVSEPIHDKKAMSDLVITKLSHCSAPATGGREVILLCDRISKDDIQIRFFEESRDGKLIWETYTDISPADVHKQVAICFKTPKYYNPNITQPVMARIQLKRVSDNQFSEPRMFQFLPCESDEDLLARKRQKMELVNNYYAFENKINQ